MTDYSAYFDQFCGENHIEIALSYEMPEGYETAFGSFDVVRRTLFLNLPVLQSAPEHEALFYLCHELRHALQYLRPELFDELIQTSRYYVVLYDGVCYKLVGDSWKKCILSGSEEYFRDAYLSLPYEVDANLYAYQKVQEIVGGSPELEKLYSFWMPKRRFLPEELRGLFRLIDANT